MSAVETTQVHMEERSEEVRRLSQSITKSSPADAAELLSGYPDSLIEEVRASLNPLQLQEVLAAFPRTRRELILAAAAPEYRRQWVRNDTFPEDCIGRLMEPALAVCQPDLTIAEAAERVRSLVTRAFIVYIYFFDFGWSGYSPQTPLTTRACSFPIGRKWFAAHPPLRIRRPFAVRNSSARPFSCWRSLPIS